MRNGAARPRPGLLFLFPSWLLHQVRPDRGQSLCISIAFNLSL
ncbi:MAG: putative 2OG-Fe(II) oxygenase [Acetobacteraceae bacterium]